MDQQTEDRLAVVRALMDPPGNASTSSVQINAGSWGVYVCVTLVAITLAVVAAASLFVALQLQDLRKADETFQAYIHAGYVEPAQPEPQPEEVTP